jgi:hypothetical protein
MKNFENQTPSATLSSQSTASILSAAERKQRGIRKAEKDKLERERKLQEAKEERKKEMLLEKQKKEAVLQEKKENEERRKQQGEQKRQQALQNAAMKAQQAADKVKNGLLSPTPTPSGKQQPPATPQNEPSSDSSGSESSPDDSRTPGNKTKKVYEKWTDKAELHKRLTKQAADMKSGRLVLNRIFGEVQNPNLRGEFFFPPIFVHNFILVCLNLCSNRFFFILFSLFQHYRNFPKSREIKICRVGKAKSRLWKFYDVRKVCQIL